MDQVTSNLRLILQRPERQQYAALCYRLKKKQGPVEVLLATSRDTGRWVIPKGWPMEGKKAHQVAEQEAFEEAGVKGKADKNPLGFYHYKKTLDNGLKIPVKVQVHSLNVDECVKNFREKGVRTLEWVSCEEAALRVQEPELKQLFGEFSAQMTAQPTSTSGQAAG